MALRDTIINGVFLQCQIKLLSIKQNCKSMKKILLSIAVTVVFAACKNKSENSVEAVAEAPKSTYISIGAEIDSLEVLTVSEMNQRYAAMPVGDTSVVRFKATITDVCQAKGCWMKLDLENGQQAMVKFKDYAFFMPKDSKGKQVIVNGKAFVNEMPVDEQKHYAEDAGKSKEEVNAITQPLKTFSFEADGVLLKQ